MEELDIEAKKDVHKMVLSNVRQHNGGRLSNGCLMRISPLAIASANFSIERYSFRLCVCYRRLRNFYSLSIDLCSEIEERLQRGEEKREYDSTTITIKYP